METGVKGPRLLAVLLERPRQRTQHGVCSYYFPPEPTGPGAGVAAEGLWASLAGQSLCQRAQHREERAEQAVRGARQLTLWPAQRPLPWPPRSEILFLLWKYEDRRSRSILQTTQLRLGEIGGRWFQLRPCP